MELRPAPHIFQQGVEMAQLLEQDYQVLSSHT